MSISESATGSFVPTNTSESAFDSATIPTSSSSLNETLLQQQIPEGQLPLQPIITPGWAVAGVVLLGTGVAYALAGIKAKWLYTFFSAAFLASLGTTVLIIYVMTPPVSNTVQGGYVVAVVCTGLILGVLAAVFKEVTECLSCLLGGFSLSMWLLALRPGGLISDTSGKAALIAVFTAGGTCLYFTKWTRTYSLICGISFTGATVTVIGIDCFSRAGLREFWAYIWALNDRLFPLGAVTYPLTRGIRVELALTVLIFLAGIVSQLKLWRIVRERRNRKDADLVEGERRLQAEEENVGRQVEEVNSRERLEWERIHGSGNAEDSASQFGHSNNCRISDMGCEKPAGKAGSDATTPMTTMTTISQLVAGAEMGTASPGVPVEREETPFPLEERLAMAERAMARDGTSEGGKVVTVRVADDDTPDRTQSPFTVTEGDKADAGGKNETGGVSSALLPYVSNQDPPPLPPIPIVVSLPFRIPSPVSNDDGSSAATFADEEDGHSKTPFMSPSIRGDNSVLAASEHSAGVFAALSRPPSAGQGERGKEATSIRSAPSTVGTDPSLHGENVSVVANLDDLESVDGESADDNVASPTCTRKQTLPQTILTGTSGRDTIIQAVDGDSSLDALPETIRSDRGDTAVRAMSVAEEEGCGPTSTTPRYEGPSGCISAPEYPAGRDESITATVLVAANLTEGNLPPPLSKIAKSYRTNEWAKHVSIAEVPVPEPEQFSRSHQPGSPISPALSEEAVPVNVWELQQTPNNALPPPTALSGDLEWAWNRPGHLDSTSRTDKGKPLTAFSGLVVEEGNRSPHHPFHMLVAPTNPDPRRPRASTSLSAIRDLPTSTPSPNLYGPPPHSTLIGMRETLLRNKASYGRFLPQPRDVVPVVPPPALSEMGSSGSRDRSSWTDDDDDMPLSQRRAMIRRSNDPKFADKMSRAWSPVPVSTAETATFNSHQPQRHSTAPSEAVRQAQLANFRNSVAMDLRVNRSATPPVHWPGLIAQAVNLGGQGRGVEIEARGSVGSLRGARYRDGIGLNGEPRHKTSLMILRAENEAGAERERAMARNFLVEERMRSSVMMEAHRDALRRMQSGVKGL